MGNVQIPVRIEIMADTLMMKRDSMWLLSWVATREERMVARVESRTSGE